MRRHGSGRAPRARGFTLVELLLAATIGAALLMATANMAGSFATSVNALEEVGTGDLDAALARMASDVRYGRYVEVPSASTLRITDPRGGITEYGLRSGSLYVRRPSGSEGLLATDLAAAEFQATTMRRLRDGAPVTTAGTVHQVAATGPIDRTVELKNGHQLALGFTLDEAAGPGAVADINELLTFAAADTLALRLAAGAGLTGTITFDLYAAASIGDATPMRGTAPLATRTFELSLLPVVAANLDGLVDGLGMVKVCHAGVTTRVLVALVPTHLAHGDTLGNCGEDKAVFPVPAADVNLDVGFAGARLVPGVGYSLVITVRGTGSVAVLGVEDHWDGSGAADDEESAAGEMSVLSRTSSSSSWSTLDRRINFRLAGERTRTSTAESQVVDEVTMRLVPPAGEARSATAAVYGQVIATDPWMGVAPGDPVSSP